MRRSRNSPGTECAAGATRQYRSSVRPRFGRGGISPYARGAASSSTRDPPSEAPRDLRLRIVAGDLGGRYIDAPRGRRTRPTAERVREAWFSVLADDVDGARVADLYAGSGALGIEALSRGAAHVHFVESDRRAASLLLRNIAALDLAERSRVVRGDAIAWVDGLDGLDVPLDLVIADPPYASTGGARLVERFRARPFAAQLWVEHGPEAEWAARADWTREYGDTCLSRFRAPANASTRIL